MRIRVGSILTGFTLILAGFAVVLLHKTTCRPQISRSEGSNLADIQKATIVATLRTLTVAGMQCNVHWGIELWGEPLIWGDLHHTASEAECCAACHAHRSRATHGGLDKGVNSSTCNTWVFCGDREHCGSRYGECWLKHQAVLPPADVIPGTANYMWTSGLVYGDEEFAQAYDKYNKLIMHTKVGDIVVTLMPELAPNVVRELRREVITISEQGTSCANCRFYRAEDFGIQGVIQSPGCYIASPEKGYPGPADPKRKIPPGYVCRAGMGGSPHFFINFFEADWGDALCWGRVEDLSLSQEIAKRPIKAKATPNDLSMLVEELSFNMTLAL